MLSLSNVPFCMETPRPVTKYPSPTLCVSYIPVFDRQIVLSLIFVCQMTFGCKIWRFFGVRVERYTSVLKYSWHLKLPPSGLVLPIAWELVHPIRTETKAKTLVFNPILQVISTQQRPFQRWDNRGRAVKRWGTGLKCVVTTLVARICIILWYAREQRFYTQSSL